MKKLYAKRYKTISVIFYICYIYVKLVSRRIRTNDSRISTPMISRLSNLQGLLHTISFTYIYIYIYIYNIYIYIIYIYYIYDKTELIKIKEVAEICSIKTCLCFLLLNRLYIYILYIFYVNFT